MSDFLYMGGYAAYVWSAYGLAAVVLVGMIVHSLLWQRRVLKTLKRQSRRPAKGTGQASSRGRSGSKS